MVPKSLRYGILKVSRFKKIFKNKVKINIYTDILNAYMKSIKNNALKNMDPNIL